MSAEAARAEAARPAPRRISLGKKLAFSSVMGGFLLVVGEVTTRALGLGDPEAYGGSRLRVQWVFPPVFKRTQDGTSYRPTDVRLVDRAWPRAQASGQPVRRIFVFGESAVAGLGFSENASFPRALERQIAAGGGTRTVVVNCGIPQIAAKQVHVVERNVVKQLQSEGQAPRSDVFVFYVGNNEFSSIFAENYRQLMHGDPSLPLRLDRFFERFRIYTTFKGLSLTLQEGMTPAIRPIFPDAVKLPNPPRLSADDVRGALAGHLAQLRAMVEDARAIGATPVLATVATNEEWDAREEPKGGWLADACGGAVPEDAAERQARLEAAEKADTAELARPDRTNVEQWRSRLRRAHVRRALGRAQESRQDFMDAFADDPYHLRCVPEMNENVRALAAELKVPLADVERELEKASPGGVIGYPLVYDNVHLTLDCNERVAAIVEKTLVDAKLLPPGTADTKGYFDARAALFRGAEAGTKDSLLVEEWIGWNDDAKLPANRDGKKFIAMRAALDEKAKAGTASAEELVWAGNGYALEPGGEPRARELYALAVAKSATVKTAVDANLAWLDRRPK